MLPTADSITIELLQPQYLGEIRALGSRTQGAARWSESQYAQLLGTGRRTLVAVARESSVVVAGFLTGTSGSDDWEIENIVVDAQWQRRRIGSRLLGEFLSAARRHSALRVLLEVRASNAAAIALYKDAGFQLDGTRKAYYFSPVEDGLLFSHSLKIAS